MAEVANLNGETSRRIDLLDRRSISRRDVMQGLIAAGLTASAAAELLANAQTARAAEPKRGGRVRSSSFAGGPAETMDPLLGTMYIDYVRWRATYNSLLRLTDKLTVEPELAEEYSVSRDGLEYTFKIRKGVEFHDGKTLTADDVAFTMNRHVGKDTVSKAKAFVDNIREWKSTDPTTVKAYLNSPNSDLPVILGIAPFKIHQDGQKDFSKPVGTGPFKLEEFKPGIRSIHSRFANYWVQGRPYLDELELFVITDPATRANALISGEVQLIAELDPKLTASVERTQGLSLLKSPPALYNAISVMTDRGPGRNSDFRLALKYLQRREDYAKLMGDPTEIATDHPIGAGYPEHCADLPQRPFDPDKAKFHLQKTDITGATIHFGEIASGVPDMCLLLQSEARKIGLNLDLQKVPAEGFYANTWQKTDINVVRFNMRPTAGLMYRLAFVPGAPFNDTHWNNERFSKLVDLIRAEQDPAKLKQYHCEAQALISDDCGSLIPAFSGFVDGISNKLQGMTKVPLANCGGAEWPEFVWLNT